MNIYAMIFVQGYLGISKHLEVLIISLEVSKNVEKWKVKGEGDEEEKS